MKKLGGGVTFVETIDLSVFLNGTWEVEEENGGFLKAYRRNGVVTVTGNNVINPSTGSQYTAILPLGWRPAEEIGMPALNQTDNNWNWRIHIEPNGRVDIANPGFTSWYERNKRYNFTITFVAV